MVTLQTQLQPHPTVLATTLPNQEILLLHLENNCYYTLNETGTQIWQGLCAGRTLSEISQSLVAQYPIALAEAEAAVLALLHKLAAENLVH